MIDLSQISDEELLTEIHKRETVKQVIRKLTDSAPENYEFPRFEVVSEKYAVNWDNVCIIKKHDTPTKYQVVIQFGKDHELVLEGKNKKQRDDYFDILTKKK